MAKASVQRADDVTDAAGVERRKTERTPLVVRVDYETVDQLFSEFARNINEGGIFIETEKPHPVGTGVRLQFRVPGSDDPVLTRGTVVHIAQGGGKETPGMGIEFDELDADARDHINELVRRLRAEPPPSS